MATLEALLDVGRIDVVEGIGAPGAVNKRQLYIVIPEASDDIARMIGKYTATWSTQGLSIADQVNMIFHDFLSGKSLHHPKGFHVLDEVEDGIWELKSDDVRLFGWFIAKDAFVIATSAYATMAKDGKYASFISAAKFRRRDVALNNGKYVEGGAPGNVISSFHTT